MVRRAASPRQLSARGLTALSVAMALHAVLLVVPGPRVVQVPASPEPASQDELLAAELQEAPAAPRAGEPPPLHAPISRPAARATATPHHLARPAGRASGSSWTREAATRVDDVAAVPLSMAADETDGDHPDPSAPASPAPAAPALSDAASPALPTCTDPLAGLWTSAFTRHGSAYGGAGDGWTAIEVRFRRESDGYDVDIRARFGLRPNTPPTFEQCQDRRRASFDARWHTRARAIRGRGRLFGLGRSDASLHVACGPEGWVPEFGDGFQGSVERVDDDVIDVTWTDASRGFTHLGLVRRACTAVR